MQGSRDDKSVNSGEFDVKVMLDETSGRIPGFKQKFAAWWHGYDLDTVEEQAPDSEQDADAPRVVSAPRFRQDLTARAAVLQELWGPGSVSPGTAEFMHEITAYLGLTAEMSMLDIGAGLGGPSRAISEEYGIWVTAYETREDWVAAGMEQSKMAGMAKKVPLALFDPETLELPERKFDCVLSKEFLHALGGKWKKRLLGEVKRTLKPNGQLLITDYIAAAKSLNDGVVGAWNENAELESRFWTKDDYEAALAENGLEVCVTEDISEKQVAFISTGFRTLSRRMEDLLADEADAEKQANLRRALAFETRRWAIRSEILQGGDVQLLRLSAINHVEPDIR